MDSILVNVWKFLQARSCERSVFFLRGFIRELYSVKRYESIAAMTREENRDIGNLEEVKIFQSGGKRHFITAPRYRLRIIPALILYVIRFTRAIELTITGKRDHSGCDQALEVSRSLA